MKKKLLSMLLALCMVVTLFPASALAAEGATAQNGATEKADGHKFSITQSNATTYYTTMEAVMNAAQDGATITLLSDTADGGIQTTSTGRNLTFDLGGFTYSCGTPAAGSTNTKTQGCQILSGNTITIKNGTLAVQDGNEATLKTLIQNYGKLTLENVTLDGTNLGLGNYSGVGFPATATFTLNSYNDAVTLNNVTIKNSENNTSTAYSIGCGWWGAQGWYPSGTQITINQGCSLTNVLVYRDDKNQPETVNSTITAGGQTIKGSWTGDACYDEYTYDSAANTLKKSGTAEIALTGSTVKQITGTLNPIDVTGAETVNVTVKPSGELKWSGEQAAAGGTNARPAGWYAGIQIVAPNAITDANVATARFANSADKLTKSFGVANDGKVEGGSNYVLNCWGGISETVLQQMKEESKTSISLTWKFDWNGDDLLSELGTSVSNFDTWTADQTFTLTIDLSDPNLKLLDQDDNQVWPEVKPVEAEATATAKPENGAAAVDKSAIDSAISSAQPSEGGDQSAPKEVTSVTIDATTDNGTEKLANTAVTLSKEVVEVITAERTEADGSSPAVDIQSTTIQTDVVDVTLPTAAITAIDGANTGNKISEHGLKLEVADTTGEAPAEGVAKVIEVNLYTTSTSNTEKLTVNNISALIKLTFTLDKTLTDPVVTRDGTVALDKRAENNTTEEGYYITGTTGTIWTKHLSTFTIGEKAAAEPAKITATYNAYAKTDSEYATWGSGKLTLKNLEEDNFYTVQLSSNNTNYAVYQVVKAGASGEIALRVQPGLNLTLFKIGADESKFAESMGKGPVPGFNNVRLTDDATITQQ